MSIITRHILRLLFSSAILLFFILHTTKTVEWEFINALEHTTYDVRLELSMPNIKDERIVIVDIDERSLSEIGRWPWNRSVVANLIDQLFDTYQIDILAMDAVFVEPDDSSGLTKLRNLAQGPLRKAPVFLKTLKELEKKLDYDGLLANSLAKRKIVLGYTFTNEYDSEAGKLPNPVLSGKKLTSVQYKIANGYAANLAQFQDNAMSGGHFAMEPDADGIVRRVPMLYGYENQLYESLSLATARLALSQSQLNFQPPTLLKIGQRKIPTDKNLQALIPYQGIQKTYLYVSATDILHNRIQKPNLLKNKIILLGTTAQGLSDLLATPVGNLYPEVEIHANLISGILDNNFKFTFEHEEIAEVLLLIFISIIMVSLLPLCSPATATGITLGLSGLLILLNIILWNTQNLVFPLATVMLLILIQFIFNMSYGYFVESTNKRYITNLFGQYVPIELVDEMSKNIGNDFSMESESREMTVLFSDVRGFTNLSEGLEPRELSLLMNEYLTPMTYTIHEYRGTIDKYMGDAIMAFWGAPLHEPKHARCAIESALQMLQRLQDLQVQFKAKGWPEIDIGIGLNTGMMNVGNMGSQFRMAYTVLGDAVNLGSRLEGLTKQYGVKLIVSEMTYRAAPEYFYRELDKVRVKGKEQPVAIFEPIALLNQIDANFAVEVNYYKMALKYYRQQSWDMATAFFTELSEKKPKCLLYKVYLKRIENFIKNPPAKNWDGVYNFVTK
ncbi:MAG: adenylate/guanylate cyclase domain-containing protein [Candidatus Marithrix sp.]|nr:adenylate/guanylate cyclase domain-containing protein [Candidatus Marithrix sp.]